MSDGYLRFLAIGTLLVSATCLLTSPSAAQSPPATKVGKPLDLAHFLDLGRYYVKSVLPTTDPKTDFIVGGKNDTDLIRSLKEINSRTIAELEQDMRPGAQSDVASERGFLGPDEKLLDVLVEDNQYVLEEMGMNHQELAKHLHAVGTIGYWQRNHGTAEAEFVYHGRRFKVKLMVTRGSQPSPFRDGTTSGSNVSVQNLDNGKKLDFALLVPYMIERYGFYEGKETPYRVDPQEVMEVFDFLKLKKK